MNQFTFRKLEYEKIVRLLAEQCTSNLGKEKALQLEPMIDKEQIELWQQETTEGVTMRRFEPNIPLGGIIDIKRQLRKVEIGGMLEPEEFLQLQDVLIASRRLNQFLVHRKKNYDSPRLQWWGEQLVVFSQLEKRIEDVIAPEAVVRDNASPELLTIRRKIATLRNRIKEKLENIVRSESSQKYLQDALVTMRNDRYVVPVKQEYKNQIPGIVHDQSASGATLFIEPMAVVEMNNDLRKAYSSQRDEILRILMALSQEISPFLEDIKYNLEVLTHIDFIFAKARLSEKLQAVAPIILEKAELNLMKARHPLIDPKVVVPLSITLGQQYDSVIITGPNTGGKTVTLKTVGLLILMAQSGLHIPAEVGSEIGVFHSIFADIGDEQSIEQSLSTFSSHMTNIVKILESINHRSLVLLDELGAGTDPTEGAALAMSIMDYIMHKQAKIIATTHYSELKAYAFEKPRVQNASVEFDIETLRPTYRLLIGVPGKSNAFEIAKKLGISGNIIEQARGFVSQEEQDVAGLIQSLESNNLIAEQKRKEAEEKLQQVEQHLHQLEKEREKLIHSTDRLKRRAEDQALEIVRKARQESEDIIKELRHIQHEESAKAQVRAQELRKNISSKEEKLAKDLHKGPKITTNKVTSVVLGQEVYIPKFTQHGSVLTLPNGQGTLQVQVGIMKVTVNLDELQISEKKKETTKGTVKKLMSNKSSSIKNEIDLRGMLVDEALDYVDKYLDDAYLSSLGQVNIIHGKGTGALREAITAMLKRHPHVEQYRLGGFSEGGAGVTIVELRK